MSYDLALITGASSGIGECFARQLPDTTDLILCGLDHPRLDRVAEELARPGRRIDVHYHDLGTPEGQDALLRAVRGQPVDLAIANAGFGLFGRFLEHDPAELRSMVELNSVMPLRMIRELAPGMIERARGAGRRAGFIVTSSVVAFMPLPNFTTYAATKSFQLSLGDALAGELRDQPIDLLTLLPGTTRTRFHDRAHMPKHGEGHSAERVAREGLAMLGRTPIHVVGLGNRAVPLIARFFPRWILRYGAKRFFDYIEERELKTEEVAKT